MSSSKYKKIIYSDESALDITDIVNYYNNIDKKLVEKLYRELGKINKILLSNPLLYRIRYREIRRVSLKNFDFSIFYRIDSSIIVIVRVLHNHRDPVIWP